MTTLIHCNTSSNFTSRDREPRPQQSVPPARSDFREDFMQEHSRPGVQITFAKTSATTSNTFLKESPQTFEFPC